MTDAPQDFRHETAQRGLRRGLITVLGFFAAIGIGLMALSQTDVGAAAMADVWGRANPWLLIPAFGLMTLAFLCMGLRWRSLMPAGHRPPAGGLMAIVCAGLLLNYALPGPMGELGAAWFASRRYGVPLAASLASGVAARLVGLATAALTATLVWMVADLPVPPEYRKLVGTAVVLIGIVGGMLAVVTARPEPWKRLAHWVLEPLAVNATPLGHKAAEVIVTLDRTADSLAEVARARPQAWLAAMGWSFGSHLSVVSGVALACASIQTTADPAGLLFTYATTTAGAVALFVMPGSQIGWDAMFLGLLVASAGLSLTDATAIALIVRVHHLLVMVLGALALVWLLRQAAESSQDD